MCLSQRVNTIIVEGNAQLENNELGKSECKVWYIPQHHSNYNVFLCEYYRQSLFICWLIKEQATEEIQLHQHTPNTGN